MSQIIDVLVVGAGPVGLFCANELKRQGLHCRIIEKKAALSDKSKALALHIRTLDVFHDTRFLDAVMAQAHQVDAAILKSNGKQLAELDFLACKKKYHFLLDLAQSKTEQILYEGLLAKGVAVEWQSELVNIEQQSTSVTATIRLANNTSEQIQAHWIIACDGAHSTLRKLVAAEFLGAPYSQFWWLADLHIDWPLPENKMIINANEHGPLACFPMGDKRYRIVLTAPNNEEKNPSFEDVIKEFNLRTSDQAVLSDPIWICGFSIHHRQIQQYKHGRVFFAGDAAHIHSPMGGQGLNTGIQDTYNLAWKLALVQKGLAHEKLLSSYHDERFPIGKNVLKKTDVMTKLILIKNHFLITLRNYAITVLSSFAVLRKAFANDLAELNISYAKSSIVKKIGLKTPFKLGEYIPLIYLKTNNTEQSLETICQGTMHHLFLFIGKKNAEVAPLEKIADALNLKYKAVLIVHLVTPAAHEHFTLNDSSALLVRPDKYIGLIQSPVNLTELENYFNDLFIS